MQRMLRAHAACDYARLLRDTCPVEGPSPLCPTDGYFTQREEEEEEEQEQEQNKEEKDEEREDEEGEDEGKQESKGKETGVCSGAGKGLRAPERTCGKRTCGLSQASEGRASVASSKISFPPTPVRDRERLKDTH